MVSDWRELLCWDSQPVSPWDNPGLDNKVRRWLIDIQEIECSLTAGSLCNRMLSSEALAARYLCLTSPRATDKQDPTGSYLQIQEKVLE